MNQTEDKPTADALPLAKTVVSVKITVPLVQYGNIEMFVSQEIFSDEHTTNSQREGAINDMLERLQFQLVQQIVPMAEADVLRCKSVLEKEDHPDAWMQRNSGMYRWIRVAAPDLKISAMEAILRSEQLPA